MKKRTRTEQQGQAEPPNYTVFEQAVVIVTDRKTAARMIKSVPPKRKTLPQ